ncbi:MAG TPA: hypothetical protein VMT96_00730 [Candidatus Bathyarchaeia archaeon]|nr:hypothetical protein [Candidatus Bathyarchaeia archaeon]
MSIESQPPQGNDEQEPKFETTPTFDGLLKAPLEGDNLVTFGQRLHGQIKKSPAHLKLERAERAKARINEHFSHHYGQLMFASTNHAIVFRRGENSEPNAAIEFNHVNVSGELRAAFVIGTDDEPFVAYQLDGATLHWSDTTDGELRSFECDSPVVLPICYITSHELL